MSINWQSARRRPTSGSLANVMGLCGLVTGVVSGYLQEALGYVAYFWFVMAATIPSFVATWFAPFHHAEAHATDAGAARTVAA